ncbi:MAG: 50S ribosomal protein L5 [Candidatus Berkelbacteria bacterium]|nr:50S ribosomal protein L5 [Candidatus Berkelbacteria bacterium]MCR4307605.1 50S ribosomal protein L5 [Candidatus Berkelbacteria bacterium]
MSKIDVKEKSTKIRVTLSELLGIKNVNALPKLKSVNLNVGLGQNKGNKDMVTYIVGALGKITGQKPVITRAKKAIAGFKIRSGDEVGVRVTLRGNKMYDFIDRLINVSLPRIRDFKGINPKSFDQSGNLTIGFKDQVAFVELGHDGLDKPFGVEVTFTISNSNPSSSAQFLKELGFPMKVS